MTTFEDLDLAEAFEDFSPSEETGRRHRGWITAVAMLLAAVLVGCGLVWLFADRSSTPVATVTAEQLEPLLAQPQNVRDQPPAAALDGTSLVSTSTRFLTMSSLGTLYAATTANGRLCLLAVPKGDLPATSCTRPRAGAVVLLQPDVDGPAVQLVPQGGKVPTGEGWKQLASGVYEHA
ncbi:hypothetical protein [Cellulomonas sp. HZM]|uniref:hypothetical protein n=1 Tax=Cellulomonas sp. HZM TaxID=1454010 RepID=UPI000493A5C5|nr:hypothetical protein [Cellulomonas sp. HZM]